MRPAASRIHIKVSCIGSGFRWETYINSSRHSYLSVPSSKSTYVVRIYELTHQRQAHTFEVTVHELTTSFVHGEYQGLEWNIEASGHTCSMARLERFVDQPSSTKNACSYAEPSKSSIRGRDTNSVTWAVMLSLASTFTSETMPTDEDTGQERNRNSGSG